MKKAQLEMIGLMIIVIILVLGGLFYLRFALTPEEKKEDTSVQAYNLMNAVLNVYICGNTSLRSAIVSCDLGESICDNDCDFNGDYSFFSNQLDNIVSKVTYLNYSFYVNKGEIEVFKVEGCKYGQASQSYPISERNEYYEVFFKLCKT